MKIITEYKNIKFQWSIHTTIKLSHVHRRLTGSLFFVVLGIEPRALHVLYDGATFLPHFHSFATVREHV
jgi:hypothetical protein